MVFVPKQNQEATRWYFDSKYADGSSLVIIFYTKHVTSFSKNYKPFVSLNYINPNGKELRTELWSDDYSFSKDRCDVRIGECYMKGDLNHQQKGWIQRNADLYACKGWQDPDRRCLQIPQV